MFYIVINYLVINKKQNGLFLILFVIIGLCSVHLLGEFSSVKGSVTGGNQDKVFVMYAGSLVKIFEDVHWTCVSKRIRISIRREKGRGLFKFQI